MKYFCNCCRSWWRWLRWWRTQEGSKRQKRVNQDVYIDILNKNLRRSLRKTGCFIFMQDGAPCHTAKKVQQSMVWWSSLGHSSSMGSSESWYEHHREFVDSVETRSCQVTSRNKQRGTEGKDFVSLEEPWKKTWCPEEPVWFNAQTCLCLGPV